MSEKYLSICLDEYLPDPLPARTEYEFPVRYEWHGTYTPARLHPWPGDPAEYPELEIETCATDIVKGAWLWYSTQYAGLPPVTEKEFCELTITPLATIIENADYTEDCACGDDDDFAYECERDRRLGL